MRLLLIPFSLLLLAAPTHAYIEVPHSLGRCVHESTNIVYMEVLKVNRERNLIIYRKLADLKGQYPANEIRHNIGQKGFHPREWQNIMKWAEPGKKAVFMYNGNASETCIDTYWYQAYAEGEWWGMSHAEPFLLRTFYGSPEQLAELIVRMLKGEVVTVPCLADGNKNQLHERKGKLQRMRASIKQLEYNPKKDFVGWGGDGDEIEYKTTEILAPGTKGWRYLPLKQVIGDAKHTWMTAAFDDAGWRLGKAPIGYGEPEIGNRRGTLIPEQGEDFVFRRIVMIPEEQLRTKDVVFRINMATDDSALVYLNGLLVDTDPEPDHEFAYWNREIELPAKAFKPGPNLLAFHVRNKQGSSDLYFDIQVEAAIPIVKKVVKPTIVLNTPQGTSNTPAPSNRPTEEPRDPNALKVDPATKTLTLACTLAPRKLAHLDAVYPIEVIATYPAPRGQKAHETIVTFKGIKPSEIHKACLDLGLKPGKPAFGEAEKADGTEVVIELEFTDPSGKMVRLPLDKCLVSTNGAPVPAFRWLFTGSTMKQPDPEKDDQVYGADLTGTLMTIFPVTDSCVFQTRLTMKDEPKYRLEIDAKLLPKEGSPAKLLIRPAR